MFDESGYHDRWAVSCTNLLSQERTLIVAHSSLRSGVLQIIMPAGGCVYLGAEQARELAHDLQEAARTL